MPQLDILRAVAIFLVLGHHFAVAPENAGRFQLLAKVWFCVGWTGVDLFFVLSGFLVGGLIFREIALSGTLDVKRFLIRRAFKIWPAYYIYLFAFGLLLYHRHHSLKHCLYALLPNILHVQNFTMPPAPHTWSLGVEEHFYLALPLLMVILCRLVMRRRNALFVGCVVCVLVGCCAMRVLLNSHLPFNDVTMLFPTYLRIDSLMFGVLIAWLNQLNAERFARLARYNKSLFFLGVALISPMAYYQKGTSPFVWTWGFLLLYLGYGCILVSVFNTQHTAVAKLFTCRPAILIAKVGMYSYGIYLWHIDFVCLPFRFYLAYGWLTNLPPTLHWLVGTALYLAAAVTLGVVMSRLIEWPALHLRERLFPGKTKEIPRVHLVPRRP